MYKAFKSMGIETHWIDPANGGWSYDPNDRYVDFDDALIFSEYYANSQAIPRIQNSTYAIHYVGNKGVVPGALDFLGRVRRFIDVRHCPMNYWDDKNYYYKINDADMPWVGPGSRFQPGDNYDIFYMNWATDLLPHEIDFEHRFIKRERKIHWTGTIGGGQGGVESCNDTEAKYDNRPSIREFKKACDESGIDFISSCPWLNPVTPEQLKILAQKSWVAPDFRHPAMIEWGYIPCRVMKHISYGQLGATNSKAVYEFFDGNVIFNEDPYQLFFDCQERMNDTDMILDQMKLVKEKHTYINRCKSLIKIVNDS
tara:strand:- start:1483 stop:2418 length:936 start_codon:yes stop_codon:yes gene_type:complete